MEYQVEFDDKIRSMISVTYGPMKDLIAKYERDQAKKGQSKKGKQNEDEKENSKPKRGRPKKDDSTEEQPTVSETSSLAAELLIVFIKFRKL